MTRVLYYLMLAAGVAAAGMLNSKIAAKRGQKTGEAVKLTLMGFAAGVLGAMAMSLIYNAVLTAISGGAPFEKSRYSLYGGLLFMPPVMFLLLRLLRLDFADAVDVCAPGVYALLGCGKVGCAIYGCCYGVACSVGVHTPFAAGTRFPVQLTEAAFCFLLAAALAAASVTRALPPGGVYPAGLTVYAAGRFFLQFLRAHEIPAEKNLPLGLDIWQWVSLAALCAGGVWLIVIFAHRKQKQP